MAVLFSLVGHSAPTLKPEFKTIELQEFTTMNISVMPDAGTQLIFPFMLDNPDLIPEIKISLTTGAFSIDALGKQGEKNINGQNTMTITANLCEDCSAEAIFFGNLFITIGGYNLSIALKTETDTRKVVSNYVFKIPNEERTHLIENTIEKYKKKLDEEFSNKLKDIDRLARKKSLVKLATIVLVEPEYTPYNYDADILINGDRWVVGVDEFVSYGNDFHSLTFDINNFSNNDFKVSSYSLSGRFGDLERVVSGDFECSDAVRSDGEYKCAFVTLDGSVINASELTLSISTDRGLGTFKW